MSWDIDFISEDDFREHVRNTISHYGDKLCSYDLARFNLNTIDPIKMIFDRAVYREDWETLIANEIFRQRDKTNSNEIGYFHQGLFQYLARCRVPREGWDVVFSLPEGYVLENGNIVHTIYVEMKNKHNTMNSASAGKTYMKMQNQLLHDDDCACFLVEVIARQSQNIIWAPRVDGRKLEHARIRRVSIDQFYAIVTGQPDAFFAICTALPRIVREVLAEQDGFVSTPHDTVLEELSLRAQAFSHLGEDMSMIMATYMLGFHSYEGFASLGVSRLL